MQKKGGSVAVEAIIKLFFFIVVQQYSNTLLMKWCDPITFAEITRSINDYVAKCLNMWQSKMKLLITFFADVRLKCD